MKKELSEAWKKAEETGEPVNIGTIVVCDACSEDYTNSLECGGFIFTSHAYCPKCAQEAIGEIKGYGEEKYIKARCPQFQSFADFVREYRGDNNFIQIKSLKP